MLVIVKTKRVIEVADEVISISIQNELVEREVKVIAPKKVLTPIELQDKLADMLINPIEDDSVHLPEAPVKYKRVELPVNLNNDLGYTCQDCNSKVLRTAIIHANGSRLYYCGRHNK